jgi:predicted O-methyltransferase YrrM
MPPQRVVEERGDFARNRILSERRRPVVQETVVQETVVQETANWRLHRALAAWLVAALFAAGARAAEPSVPYVPTPQDVVERMLEMAKVGPGDYLIDLGSGDGRIVVTAARKHGARGFGVDLNPVRIAEANENARKAGVVDKVAFYQRDLFATDLSQATVITLDCGRGCSS